MSVPSSQSVYQSLIQQIALAQKLTIKAFESPNLQKLIFIILNDTHHLVPYDRAVLWEIFDKSSPKLLGVSGQATYNTSSELVQKWQSLISSATDLDTVHVADPEDFGTNGNLYLEYQNAKPSTILLMPIWRKGNQRVVLWLEKWEEQQSKPVFSEEKIKILEEYLIPGYKAAWNKTAPVHIFSKLHGYLDKKRLTVIGLGLLLLLLLVRVPLRIVAPCEVVADNPYIIAAPLDGIIAQMTVKPGEYVEKGTVLYEYDTREAMHDLATSKKQLEMAQSELVRTMSSGIEDTKALDEMALENIKIKKEQQDLDYAKYRVSQLKGAAPESGVAVFENADEWRGKPVKIGEKIMFIADPNKTKVRIYIPESDNVVLKLPTEIKVFLNPYPETTLHAKLTYISQETIITETHIPSFIGEAKWDQQDPIIKLGLKGNAVISGENVSVLYYILRKPIESVRKFLGI